MTDRTMEHQDLTGRLKELEQLDGTLVRRVPEVVDDLLAPAPRGLVPVPRRSRIFLRHGDGHGSFAEVTITAPPLRHTTD
ncbi:hypothetical protein KDN32_00245 [Nocardioides sp. J2M5]|uniref:hypothetical protein n=1 Tax=Nocardioides palaemonis TaxID=2829810 RepID=UPI001BAD95C1|nr:hypothetical protein [Nocardioides palaemonis]MBS2936168.1 hypothetical protein [Nocardioides palaemonis]